MPVPHEVVLSVAGERLTNWTDYRVSSSMLTPADDFSMSVGPVTSELWALCQPDAEVVIAIDGRVVLNGYIDDRSTAGGVLSINGRDKVGRLVDESADLVDFRDVTIGDLITDLASPWFTTVTTSNARNRDQVRGRRAGKARASREPLTAAALRRRKGEPRKVEPGETRWDVITGFVREFGFLVWSTADGRELVVGRPNYSQQPQYQFVYAGPDKRYHRYANVVQRTLTDSVAELYERITVTGSNIGNGVNYGRAVTKLAATEFDQTPGRWRRNKQLILSESVRSQEAARERARDELLIRAAGARVLSLTMRGHDQARVADATPALYAVDTIAEFVDDEIGESGQYLVTDVTYSDGRNSGAVTELSLVPVGTELRLQ